MIFLSSSIVEFISAFSVCLLPGKILRGRSTFTDAVDAAFRVEESRGIDVLIVKLVLHLGSMLGRTCP